MYFILPPHLTCASALYIPRETENPKITSFHLNAAKTKNKNKQKQKQHETH